MGQPSLDVVGEDKTRLAAVERSEIDARACTAPCAIQEPLSVGQKAGPRMCVLSISELRRLRDRAALRRDRQPRGFESSGLEEDRVTRTPSRSSGSCRSRRGNRSRVAAGAADLLETSARVEADPLAVRGPERRRGVLCAWKRLWALRVERLHPEL